MPPSANSHQGELPLPSTIKAMTALQKVTHLRSLMRTHGLDGFIVPSEDAHLSEYVASCDERRTFLTSFTGSAGTALVTDEAAYLWTDGRYFVQAEKELDDSVFTLKKTYEDPSLEDWIAGNMKTGSVIGVDPQTVSISSVKRIRSAFTSNEICLKSISPNLVDLTWGIARPAIPAEKVRVHDLKYAGKSVKDKLIDVRKCMSDNEASVLILTGLDEIAWLLNLRGNDIEYNPVFWGYVIMTGDSVRLHTNSTRFLPGVNEHLMESGIEVRPYDSVYEDIKELMSLSTQSIWMDSNNCNYGILDNIENCEISVVIIHKQSPIQVLKARKNEVELKGVRDCHIRDGVALCKFLAWLDDEIRVKNNIEIDECIASDKLGTLRSQLELYISPSFPTISSAGSNGAVIHYRPYPKTCSLLQKDKMYLVDSGGQYYDGTTDVTRTVHMGTPSKWECETFTRVLQGHIALDSAVFPKGTTGHLLDAFARRPLWAVGLDYKHGTGHGVGSCLNVHEGPHIISFKPQALETALEPGFLTSNEPGYYENGKFGIRIESVCAVVPYPTPTPSEKSFLTLEHLTIVPVQKELIDVSILTNVEIKWIDDYHQECWDKLHALLQHDDIALQWLKRSTEPIIIKE